MPGLTITNLNGTPIRPKKVSPIKKPTAIQILPKIIPLDELLDYKLENFKKILASGYNYNPNNVLINNNRSLSYNNFVKNYLESIKEAGNGNKLLKYMTPFHSFEVYDGKVVHGRFKWALDTQWDSDTVSGYKKEQNTRGTGFVNNKKQFQYLHFNFNKLKNIVNNNKNKYTGLATLFEKNENYKYPKHNYYDNLSTKPTESDLDLLIYTLLSTTNYKDRAILLFIYLQKHTKGVKFITSKGEDGTLLSELFTAYKALTKIDRAAAKAAKAAKAAATKAAAKAAGKAAAKAAANVAVSKARAKAAGKEAAEAAKASQIHFGSFGSNNTTPKSKSNSISPNIIFGSFENNTPKSNSPSTNNIHFGSIGNNSTSNSKSNSKSKSPSKLAPY